MDPTQFDRIARSFAARRLSRRAALAGGVGLGVAALGHMAPVAAQEATPAASPVVGQALDTGTSAFLFVQSFAGGSITPKAGAEGVFTATLDHGLGQTIYFSDRPDRIVGAAPTEQFLKGLGFDPDNPPNAALVVDDGDGGVNIAVVELTNPRYDAATAMATYDLAVLRDYASTADLGFQQEPADLSALEKTFGAAHLFIDDCPDGTLHCRLPDSNGSGNNTLIGSVPIGYCWDYLSVCCSPCGYDWNHQCASAFTECNNNGSPIGSCDGDVTGGQYSCM